MPSPVSRVVRRSVRAGGNMVSQIVVSVAAAVCVALITNAYFGSGPEAASQAAPATATQASVNPAAALPPLEVQVIADVPDAVTPGQEVFPGAPMGVRPEALQKALGEERRERRRIFGIPIPFTSTPVAVPAREVSGG
jgi:cell division protein FtsN